MVLMISAQLNDGLELDLKHKSRNFDIISTSYILVPNALPAMIRNMHDFVLTDNDVPV